MHACEFKMFSECTKVILFVCPHTGKWFVGKALQKKKKMSSWAYYRSTWDIILDQSVENEL